MGVMKIAIVWNHPSRLLDCSFRFEQYVAGCRALGHEPVIVTTRASAADGGFDAPITTVEDAGGFSDPDFWRRLGADVALVVTWLRMPEVLRSIRAAGTRVAAISDSDGQMSLIVHPRIGLERLLAYRSGGIDTARRFKYWLTSQLRGRLRGSDEDRTVLESVRCSDVVTFCYRGAVELFRRLLAHYGEEGLLERVRIVPFTIGASYLVCPVPETKDERLVAMGRWTDPQKNAPLLAATLARFLERRPKAEVVVLGGGGEPFFRHLGERYPTFHYRGEARQEEVARHLASSRILLGTSRWESGPMAATEALALGATVVGNPIPSYTSYTDEGRFGRVSRRTSPRSLARALEDEMAAWDRGERDGRAIPRIGGRGSCRRSSAGRSWSLFSPRWRHNSKRRTQPSSSCPGCIDRRPNRNRRSRRRPTAERSGRGTASRCPGRSSPRLGAFRSGH